jgi:hypothetical protein
MKSAELSKSERLARLEEIWGSKSALDVILEAVSGYEQIQGWKADLVDKVREAQAKRALRRAIAALEGRSSKEQAYRKVYGEPGGLF